MAVAMENQAIAAAKTVFGHTEFDSTLDKLDQTLGNVKASMLAASVATTEQTKTNEKASTAIKEVTVSQEELNAKMINGAKVAAALEKSTRELNEIWGEYNKMVVANSGTTRDSQIADIEATFKKQVATLEATDPLFKEKYAAFRAIANASLTAIGEDWNSVRDKSLEGLQEMADKALATYDAMTTSGLTFSRTALKEQFDKYLELSQQVRHYGHTVEESVKEAASTIRILDTAWVTDGDIAAQTINKTTVMVRTLSGEVISLLEAQKRQSQGFSFQGETIDQFTIDHTKGGADALLDELKAISERLSYEKAHVTSWESQNIYFQDLARFNALRGAYNLLIGQAKRSHPGFAEGGTVMVGEQGPEIVRLPLGSTVYPTGMMPAGGSGAGGGISFTNTWHVNGTGAQVAREVSDIIMRQLKQGRQYGSA
jgi:hypothetical protein